jgi:hypothetical protein
MKDRYRLEVVLFPTIYVIPAGRSTRYFYRDFITS